MTISVPTATVEALQRLFREQVALRDGRAVRSARRAVMTGRAKTYERSTTALLKQRAELRRDTPTP